MRFSREFIKSIISEVVFHGIEFPQSAFFSIDSRTIKRGEIFVALKGSHVDGHDFIGQSINSGAIGLIINNDCKEYLQKIDKITLSRLAIAVVPNSLDALISLATAWRDKFTIPVIGITGSIGKTTTKELIANILKLSGKKCLASSDNQNTEIGAALNLLKIRSDHDVAIFEMGVSKRGEMARLSYMIRPTTAVITAVGHSHMEGLGSFSDIAAEKRDIFKYFKNDNIGIINGDNPILSNISYTHPIIKFGCKMTNQIQARKIQMHGASTSFTLKLYKERYKISLPINHIGPVMNGLAATAVAHVLGVNKDAIIKGLQSKNPVKSRFESLKIKGNKGTLIDDCYNASPESMKAALLAFERLEASGKKIAVLGDMLELGVNAPFWHRQLGRFLRKVPSLFHVVLVGENIKWAQKTLPAFVSYDIVPNWKKAVECLNKKLEDESIVLVKGSNSIGLKNLVSEVAE